MDNKKNNSEKEARENIEKEIDLSKYEDRDGGSLRRLNFGLWFMKNRRSFFITLILSLIILSIFLYSRVFYNLYLYIKNRPEELRILQELSTISVNFGVTKSAESLNAGIPQSFFHNGKYDFVGKIQNPNEGFIAFVSYCFLSGGVEIACGSSSVFPEEEKYVIILAVEPDIRINNLSFVINNVNWQRVDIRKYGVWDDYYNERYNFLITNIKFESNQSFQSDFSSNNSLIFNIKNNTPYNYWEVPLSIVLFNQNSIIGVNKYTVYELMSLEDRKINLSWTNSINSVSRVEIIPEINVLSENNYIKYR
jgi:hypothetical protein